MTTITREELVFKFGRYKVTLIFFFFFLLSNWCKTKKSQKLAILWSSVLKKNNIWSHFQKHFQITLQSKFLGEETITVWKTGKKKIEIQFNHIFEIIPILNKLYICLNGFRTIVLFIIVLIYLKSFFYYFYKITNRWLMFLTNWKHFRELLHKPDILVQTVFVIYIWPTYYMHCLNMSHSLAVWGCNSWVW